MLGWHYVALGLYWCQVIIIHQLHRTSHPITKRNVEYRCPHENWQHLLWQCIIVHWGCSVRVVKKNDFCDVNDQERESCYWKQNRHAESIQEGDERDVKDRWVFEMDEEWGTTVDVDVVLDWFASCVVLVESAFLVQKSRNEAEQVEKSELNQWIKCIEDHCLDDEVACQLKPLGVKVTKFAFETKAERLLLHVGIHKQRQDGCVEKSHCKSQLCDLR